MASTSSARLRGGEERAIVLEGERVVASIVRDLRQAQQRDVPPFTSRKGKTRASRRERSSNRRPRSTPRRAPVRDHVSRVLGDRDLPGGDGSSDVAELAQSERRARMQELAPAEWVRLLSERRSIEGEPFFRRALEREELVDASDDFSRGRRERQGSLVDLHRPSHVPRGGERLTRRPTELEELRKRDDQVPSASSSKAARRTRLPLAAARRCT